MAIQWGYHFITGLRDVDRQHESLVALVNRLDEIVADKSLTHEIDGAFQELTEYVREHFALEEQLMDDAGVDGALVVAHKQSHKAFVEQLANMWRTHKEDPDTTAKDLLEFLTTWIYRHILISDHEMVRDYYRKKGLTAPPSLLLTASGSH